MNKLQLCISSAVMCSVFGLAQQASAACTQTDTAQAWVNGKTYKAGTIVSYKTKYYIATNSNPGYNPTISTWYWSLYSCPVTTTPVPAPVPAPAPTCTEALSAPVWVSGSSYMAGTIVSYNGKLYKATNSNPGYNPTISTWYWSLYSCPVTSSPSTGPITESQFINMFPNRNSFYSYSSFVAATSSFPGIFSSSDATRNKQEIAAFLAQVEHETGGLVYLREINKSDYCQQSSTYPCAAGQQYYGRGPIQLSWNYNYGVAGKELGLNLLADPDLVARDAVVAWKTAMWFWMTQTGAGRYTAHNAIVNGFGFGETTRTINGTLECNQPVGSLGNTQMQMRIDYYRRISNILGVAVTNNLSC